MTHIMSDGRLTGLPELRVSHAGRDYVTVTVASHFRRADVDGTWHDVGTRFYHLTIMGKTGVALHALATAAGNIRVTFSGELLVRDYVTKDGTPGQANDVMVDHLGISLIGQDVTVTRRTREATP